MYHVTKMLYFTLTAPRLTGAELSRAQLTVMAGAIVLSILVNILLILGQN